MTTTEAEDTEDPTTGGPINLSGFEYQVKVSVWAALDLMLDKRLSQSMVLEPVSQEDIEAEIADNDQPGAAAARTELATEERYLLVIQAKLRNTEPWEHEGLLRLLKHGKRRISADKRLQDSRIRYLLVTNAGLKGVARALAVGGLGAWPTTPLPPTLKSGLSSSPDGRLGVLAGTSEWAINRHVRELLEDTFRVPHTRRQDCERALRDAAVDRMKGTGGGVWEREEVEKIVRDHGGYFASSPEVDAFVRPTHWVDLEQTLREQHAIVLLGTSGTGKTTAAQVMLDGLRGEIPGLAVVRVSDGRLDTVTAPRLAGPVAFHLEDPWGRYRLEPTALPWNEALGRLLSTAGGNLKFIVTSRSDIFNEAGLTSPPLKYIQRLEVEHYGWDERVQMYERRRSRRPWELQLTAVHTRDSVLEKLRSPLEIQRFFDALEDGRVPEESERDFVERCCGQAHKDTIEQTIVVQIGMRDAWDQAVIVWGLLKARPSLSREQILRVRLKLADALEALADDLEPFVRFLIAGHNLRQIESELRYAHPSVEAALERALKHKPSRSARLLRILTHSLVQLDDSGGDWGRTSAANLMRAIRALDDFPVVYEGSVHAAIDAWLISRLSVSDEGFSTGLQLAAEIGSDACIPARLARWLLHTNTNSDAWFRDWSPLSVSPEWYTEVAGDLLTPHICERFIRSVLGTFWTTYPDQFVDHIMRLAPGLSGAFLGAAEDLLGSSGNWNASVIARGCACDLDGFGAVALRASEQLDALDVSADDAEQLKVLNGEYDDDYEDFLSHANERANARLLLTTYVEAVRVRRGWKALEEHVQRAPFRQAWLEGASAARGVSEAEAFALMAAVKDTVDEAALWRLLADCWHPVLESMLMARVQQGLGDDVEIAALVCSVRHCPHGITSVVESLCDAHAWPRVLALAHNLSRAWILGETDRPALEAVAARLVSKLPAIVGAVADALFCLRGTRSKLAHESVALLHSLDVRTNHALLLAQAQLLADSAEDIAASIDILLSAPTVSPDVIERAVQAVGLAIETSRWPIVERSLKHRFADVRRAALEALAERTDGPLTPELLDLARDPGNRVRFALVAVLEARRYPEHVDTLVVLAADTWERVTRRYSEDSAEYPIARRAAKLLSEPSELPKPAYQVAARIAKETDDYIVRDYLLLALARNTSAAVQEELLVFVLKPDAPALSGPVARALMNASDSLSEAVVARITAEHLTHARPPVAVSLAVIVARRGASDHVMTVTRALAGDTQRRSLLVPLIFFAGQRNRGLLESLVALLPTSRALTVRRALEGAVQLPRDLIADFGDVHVIEEILQVPGLFVVPLAPAGTGAV